MTPKIAICITTHDRPAVLKNTVAKHYDFLPPGAKLFVVDDASTPDATPPIRPDASCSVYRFSQNVGIARAKNKCLELAANWGAEHIFLFDDDCWPITPDWWQSYTYHKEPHLMYIFTQFAGDKGHNLKGVVEIWRDEHTVAYNHVRGCMLYYNRKVLDVVGGFDPAYGKAMYEHTDLTNRIYNVGLTTRRVQDVPDSHLLIHSMDEHREVESTITPEERVKLIQHNKPLKIQNKRSKAYVEYREVTQ